MSHISRSTRVRRALLVGCTIAFAAVVGASSTAQNADARPPAHHAPGPRVLRGERVPPPARVTVDPATTAYLVLDDSTAVCAPNPACLGTVPAAARFLARARAAGALVVYSVTVSPGDAVVAGLAPQPGDPVVAAKADKFINTDLDQVLQSHGITTVVIVGTKANGAVLYTANDATARGYTTVVAEDGISSDAPFIQRFTLFQLLNDPGGANATNTPLAPDVVTLSTTRLISFGSAG